MVNARLRGLGTDRSAKGYAGWHNQRGGDSTRTVAVEPFHRYGTPTLTDSPPPSHSWVRSMSSKSAQPKSMRSAAESGRTTSDTAEASADPLYGIRRTLQIGVERQAVGLYKLTIVTRATRSSWPGSAPGSSTRFTANYRLGDGTRDEVLSSLPPLPGPGIRSALGAHCGLRPGLWPTSPYTGPPTDPPKQSTASSKPPVENRGRLPATARATGSEATPLGRTPLLSTNFRNHAFEGSRACGWTTG
ncbi:hypothetical protein M2428_000622 [Arthrobacter sp. ES3-54]|nr:hypothetical protein [Arthrobacter sp. ES3-54]